jgi:hypothetical protein
MLKLQSYPPPKGVNFTEYILCKSLNASSRIREGYLKLWGLYTHRVINVRAIVL